MKQLHDVSPDDAMRRESRAPTHLLHGEVRPKKIKEVSDMQHDLTSDSLSYRYVLWLNARTSTVMHR